MSRGVSNSQGAVMWLGTLFGAVHIPFAGPYGASGITLVGAGWAILRPMTGSVWPTALLHYAGNSGLLNPLLFIVVLLPWIAEAVGRKGWRQLRRAQQRPVT